MKSLPVYTLNETLLSFEVETIEQWVEENFDTTNQLCCSNNQLKIIWLTKGSGSYNCNLITASIKPNFVFCLNPSQQNKIFVDENAAGFIISFTENFLSVGELEFDLTCQANLFNLFSRTRGIFVDAELAIDMQQIVMRMMKEYANIFIFKTEILKRYLKIFLIYLTRQFDESFQPVMQTRNTEMVQKFMNALEKNYRDKKMVADYADMLFVTPNYLNEIIKKITGYSAGYHIRQRIALEAKRMALYSDNSMKEIAYDLGFLDCAHFSKFFKTITGNNFTEFKKEKLTIAIAV
ncbi:MAG: helix-turn-helix domain-containing protein [Parafilimonas sp.]